MAAEGEGLVNLCSRCRHAPHCVVPEMDISPQLEELDETLEEYREMQNAHEGNSLFIPDDVVFEVIVTECGDFEEEAYH